MSGQGWIRKVFPGANTPAGFRSCFPVVFRADAHRIFIIKGGPGVGKSTFISKIGKALAGAGYDVEFHCCASDNGSLDGVYIPALDSAIVDGTAPHILDPRNPGAVDEIINLGEHWDLAALRRRRKDILAINRQVARCFEWAYLALAEALACHRQRQAFHIPAIDRAALNGLAEGLCHHMAPDRHNGRAPEPRRLWASAITPGGLVNHLPSVFDRAERRCLISGNPGTGRTSLVERLAAWAADRGYQVEAFHCSLRPDRIEHLFLPELKFGVVSSVDPHPLDSRPGDTVIDLNVYLRPELIEGTKADRLATDARCQDALGRGVGHLAKAKALHDEVEACYVGAMHFDEIDQVRRAVLSALLNSPVLAV